MIPSRFARYACVYRECSRQAGRKEGRRGGKDDGKERFVDARRIKIFRYIEIRGRNFGLAIIRVDRCFFQCDCIFTMTNKTCDVEFLKLPGENIWVEGITSDASGN